MPNSIMYQQDGYVVLETSESEKLMTEDELLLKLKQVLNNFTDQLPLDLQEFSSVDTQAKYLLENYCEFDVGEGQYLQWYVTRWEK